MKAVFEYIRKLRSEGYDLKVITYCDYMDNAVIKVKISKFNSEQFAFVTRFDEYEYTYVTGEFIVEIIKKTKNELDILLDDNNKEKNEES